MKKFTLLLFAALMMVCGKTWAGNEVITWDTDGQLPDGVYQIVLVDNHTLCWDVSGGSPDPNATIQLWTRDDYPKNKNKYNPAQLFEVKHVLTEGTSTRGGADRYHYFYTIKNINSGLYVDLESRNLNTDTRIQQYGGTGGTSNDAQMWEILNNGGGFEIRSRLNDGTYQPRVGTESPASGKPLLSTYYEDSGKGYYKSGIRLWDFIRIDDAADGKSAKNQDVPKIDEINPNVWYRLAPLTDPAMTVDGDSGGGPADDKFGNGANVQLWKYLGGDNQKWQIEYVTTGDFANRGFYTLTSKKTSASGKTMYIHTSGSRNKDANNYKVHLWSDNTTGNQNWLIRKNEDNTYSFYSPNGVAMDVVDNRMQDGGDIQGHRPNDTPAQRFRLIQVSEDGADSPEDGLYTIRPATKFGLCLDESSVGATEGAVIHLWDHNDNHKQQQWYIQNIGGGNHRIIEHLGTTNANTDNLAAEDPNVHVMEANGADGNEGAKVEEWHWKNGDNQKWFFSYAGDVTNDGKTYKSYYIVNVKKGYYLDIKSGVIEKPTELQIWTPNGSNAQRFVIVPVTIDKSISKFDYSTMYFGNFNLRLPANVEGRTMKLNADGMSVSANATYEPGSIVPKGEGVVLHKTEESGVAVAYKFPVVEDWNSSVPQKDSENCLKGSDDETHEVFADQEADPAHSERCFVYRLTKPLDEHGTELDDPFGFYMTPPTMVGGKRYETGKYLKSNAHLCYLLAKFHAGKMANNNYPNYVSLEVFDDEETDIQALPEATNYKLQTTDEIYNLAGQRLQKMQKGINIVNGKKVMVK